MPLGTKVSLSPGHVCCDQTAVWIKVPLGREVGLGQSNIVLDGERAPSPQKRGHIPQFLAHVYCDQTAGWTKMPLGMEVGLGPGHIVLNGNPLPKKEHRPTFFGPCLFWPNGWMDQDAT